MKIKNIGTIDYSSFDHASGVSINIPVGGTLEVADAFGEYLLHETDSPGKFEKADGSSSGSGVDATDGAVKLAAEHGIDLSTIKGSGKDGRITQPDVEAEIARLEDEKKNEGN